MKRIILPVLIAALLSVVSTQTKAQSYKTALGVLVDVGNGPTAGGPQIKHFFNKQSAGNAQVLFGDDVTMLGVDYSYNQPIRGAAGLSWYAGIGPQMTIMNDGWVWYDDEERDAHTHFGMRPAVGLDFKIPGAPLVFNFDWKPWWNLTHNTGFQAARFTLGCKFTFK